MQRRDIEDDPHPPIPHPLATHPLDRVIWHALSGPHAGVAHRHGRALRYDPAYAPFAATEDDADDTLSDLRGLLPEGGMLALFTTTRLVFPHGLDCPMRAELSQLVLDAAPATPRPLPVGYMTRLLGPDDEPAMQALVDRAKPGPFAPRTPALGRYVGAFQGDRLVAMAGERMRLSGYAEVSAVCAHPEHRGQGLASVVTAAVTALIVSDGRVPFLHVMDDNVGARSVYAALGFRLRRTMHLGVVRRG